MNIRVTDPGSCNANQNVERCELGNWNVRLLERFSELHESHRSHFLAIATHVLNECLSRRALTTPHLGADLFLCRYTRNGENLARKDLTFGLTWALL